MAPRLTLLLLLVAASCRRPPNARPAPPNVYNLMGEVVRLDLPRKTATVRHGPVKDAAGKLWMEGMTMEFPIRDEKSLALLRPGVRIKAKLFQQPADFDFWLGEVEVVP